MHNDPFPKKAVTSPSTGTTTAAYAAYMMYDNGNSSKRRGDHTANELVVITGRQVGRGRRLLLLSTALTLSWSWCMCIVLGVGARASFSCTRWKNRRAGWRQDEQTEMLIPLYFEIRF